MPCGICKNNLIGYKEKSFEKNYPGLVCRECDKRAVNAKGKPPKMELDYDTGENPVFIDDIKCWRRYRFGGFVTMRDYHDCKDIREFYNKQFKESL